MDTRFKVASNLEELRTLITGQFAVSYVAFFLSRFGVFFAIDAENQIGNSISAALIFTAISEVIRLLILILADKTYLSDRHEVPAKLKIVILTWFVSAFGGSIVGGVVLEMIPQFSGHLINRVIPSGTFAFIGFALVSIVVAQVHNDRLNLSKLQEQVNLADGEQKHMISYILHEQNVREVEARLQISEGLKNLQLQIDQISATSKDIEIYKLVNQFDTYGSNVVRSLSKSLRGALPAPSLVPQLGTGFLQTLKHFIQLKNLNIAPTLSIVITILVGPVFQIPRNGFPGIIFIVGAGISLIPTLYFLKYIISRFVPEKIFERSFIMLLSTILIYAHVFFYSYTYLELASQSIFISPQATAFRITLAVIVLSLAMSLRFRLKLFSKQMEELLASNEAVVLLLKTENFRVQREFANFLHGSVQGKLASISMSLKLYLADPKHQSQSDQNLWLSKAKVMMADILNEAQNSHVTTDIGQFLTQLENSYRGLVSIKYSYPDSVLNYLDQRQNLLQAAIDVISDGLTNAIRHGQARNVEITLVMTLNSQVEIRIKDDGIGPPDRITPGFGLTHIQVMNGQWTLEKMRGGGAELVVLLSPDK